MSLLETNSSSTATSSTKSKARTKRQRSESDSDGSLQDSDYEDPARESRSERRRERALLEYKKKEAVLQRENQDLRAGNWELGDLLRLRAERDALKLDRRRHNLLANPQTRELLDLVGGSSKRFVH
jgi:hypothetical protein